MNDNEVPIIKMISLFDIDEDIHVRYPIPIILEEYTTEVIASFPEIELYASANNENEAICNLKNSIKELYIALIETRKDELGKLPLSWLRILRSLIYKTEGE